jgi:hypothetical protein
MEEEQEKPRTMSKAEMAHAYGIHRITLMKWLEPFKEKIGYDKTNHLFTPKMVGIIWEVLGRPWLD